MSASGPSGPLVSNIFINISEHWIKVLCLNIQLVPSLKVLD